MQFRVVIPEHVKAGQTIRIHCPDGTEANVKVPKGMKTGDSFIFEMAVDQLNNPEVLLETIRNNENNPLNKNGVGFLDREIVNAQDFVLALVVGLIIGLGIVIGFLLGVLYATQGWTLAAAVSAGLVDAAPLIPKRYHNMGMTMGNNLEKTREFHSVCDNNAAIQLLGLTPQNNKVSQ